MGDKHSHSDFQDGRRHDVDRRHHGNISPHLHQDQAPRKREIREGGSVRARPNTAILDLDPSRMRASAQLKMALEMIPIEELYGHQLEAMGVCGECRGTLKHPMDGHYHTRTTDDTPCEPICCGCLLETRGIKCAESWTLMKGLREKISSIVEKKEERKYYWVCVPCGHKWRNKNPKARACSECGSKRVKGVNLKEKVS